MDPLDYCGLGRIRFDRLDQIKDTPPLKSDTDHWNMSTDRITSNTHRNDSATISRSCMGSHWILNSLDGSVCGQAQFCKLTSLSSSFDLDCVVHMHNTATLSRLHHPQFVCTSGNVISSELECLTDFTELLVQPRITCKGRRLMFRGCSERGRQRSSSQHQQWPQCQRPIKFNAQQPHLSDVQSTCICRGNMGLSVAFARAYTLLHVRETAKNGWVGRCRLELIRSWKINDPPRKSSVSTSF